MNSKPEHPTPIEKAANNALLTVTAKYASLLCVVLMSGTATVGGLYFNRLVSALDANTTAVSQLDKRQYLTEQGLVTANDRLNALGQWTRRNADDIDDLKKRVYPLSRMQ